MQGKVVCINDQFPAWVYDLYTALPVKGRIYTIRDFCMGKTNPVFGLTKDADLVIAANEPDLIVRLVELVNPMDPSSNPPLELGFRAERFAPVQEDSETEYANATKVLVVGD